jgi:DNA-binding PadR family transcriptional regulator
MTNDGLILYKLMILYMLDRVDFPLTGSQISQFILDKGYTNYFNLQIAQNELIETDFIKPTTERNHTLFAITEQGKEAIELFEFKISDAIKMDILDYLREQKIELRNESAISSDYYPSNNEYVAQCSIKERNQTLLDIKITVPTQEQAIHICDSWQNKSEEIYQYLITQVWQD